MDFFCEAPKIFQLEADQAPELFFGKFCFYSSEISFIIEAGMGADVQSVFSGILDGFLRDIHVSGVKAAGNVYRMNIRHESFVMVQIH
ncbi:hypothetical protein D9M70_553760 [compost metagenome]